MLRLHRSYLLAGLLLALGAVALAGCGAVGNAGLAPDTDTTMQTPSDMMGGGDAADGMLGSTDMPGDMMSGTATPGSMMNGTDIPGNMMGGTAAPGVMMDGTSGAMEFDRMFIDMMVPHHQSATEMARVALERAEHPEIEQMANDIIAAQEGEIAQMQEWRQQWYGSSETPHMSAMPMLAGMPGTNSMGMTMNMSEEVARLRTAPEPFDLAFIDAMTKHHQDAIDAATLALEQAGRQEIKDLAQRIIDAQQREIQDLRAWRAAWYPDAAPATP